jgi:phosphoglycolate phosphatase-like HAD superfamily hydrolase
MVYAKPFEGEREGSRIDFGAFNTPSQETIDELLTRLEKAVQGSDVVILNQQIPGSVSSGTTIERINEIIERYPATTFLVDSRHYPEQYRGAALKLNIAEAARLLGLPEDADAIEEDTAQIAFQLNQKTGEPVFVTRGELGLAVAVKNSVTFIPGIQVVQSTDTVGAGDAAVAALAGSLAANATPVEAATVANIAAMITVTKLKTTGTASPREILAVAPEPNYIFHPELAESSRRATYLPDTEIETIGNLPSDLEIEHVIFDHDGTLSTLREGWENIMEPMMIRAILGKQFGEVDEPTFMRVRENVRQFIDRTTGIQTLVQMKGLADLVRQCGFVPPSEVLDEHGYKQIYNDDLMNVVKVRTEKLKTGELLASDFQIKNARLLLELLHERGVKLYLASGTDEEDVIAEAETMGYAQFFEGIYGAVGNIQVEAKRLVLERIIREHNLAGHQFATFGDGPVEMRETNRRGGFCIGVASDEVRRYGLNMSKRKRLIRAGANLIVPDYCQVSTLLEALRLERTANASSTTIGSSN